MREKRQRLLNFAKKECMDNSIEIAPRNITKEVAAFAYEQAEKKLDKQMETFDKVTGRNTTVLRWLLIGICSLAGVVASSLSQKDPNALVLWLSIYGLVSFLVIAVVLVVTGLFNKNMYTSGGGPSILLFKERLDEISRDGREDKLYALQEFHLSYLDSAISDNAKTNQRVVAAYRRAVIMIVITVIVGVLGVLPAAYCFF